MPKGVTELHQYLRAEGMVDELVRRKYETAQRIWKIRHETVEGSDETWAEWFSRVHHEDLESYGERAAAQGIGERLQDLDDEALAARG